MAESEWAPKRSTSKARQQGDETAASSSSLLGPSQLEELNDMFGIFDADQSGAIDPKEIRTQMSALGFEADNTTIYQLISDLDSDGSQKLEFTEFSGLLKDNLGIYTPEYTTRQGMREVFDYMDDLNPGSRDTKIDASNLKRICKVLGDSLSDAEIDVMIEGADRDGKGYVSFDDFYALMAGEAQRMIDEPSRIEAEQKEATSEEVKGKWKKATRVMVSDDVEHVEEKTKPKKAVSALKGKKQGGEPSELQGQEAEPTPKKKTGRKLVITEDADEDEDEPPPSSRFMLEGKRPGGGRRSAFVPPSD